LILKIFSQTDVQVPDWNYLRAASQIVELKNDWKLHFEQSEPDIEGIFELSQLGSWTELNIPDANINRGTGIYQTTFNMDYSAPDECVLDLGDVCESARVIVNGQPVATLWSVPFECKIGRFLKKGQNSIQIEVTNLPANAIADLDRRKVPWRMFKEINMVDRNYKKSDYSSWKPVPSGLLGSVRIKIQQPLF